MRYTWMARPPEDAGEPVNAGELPEPVAELLRRRGVDRAFMEAPYSALSPWHHLPGAKEAAAIIRSAVEDRGRILVHGDFDADGITATATAVRVLRSMGASVTHHLPCRFEEGYGVGEEGVRRCLDEGINLFLTVDCGITAVEQVEALRKNGVSVVVTDHHVPGDTLPPADAVVDPLISGSTGAPWHHLSGAGVIHTVLRGVHPNPESADLEPDLAAIGTVCDMVPLTGDNRILVRRGLQVINESPPPGILALLRESGASPGEAGVMDIGFGLGPRINSAGRVAHADTSLKLLLETDPRQAAEYAAQLGSFNEKRKDLDAKVYQEALAQLDGTDAPLAVAASDRWHPGVIGISASRLSRKLNRPAVLIAWDGDQGRGSARGLPGMEVHGVLSAAMDQGLLERFGGHSMAAGLTISRTCYDDFRKFIQREARELFGEAVRPVLYIDGRLMPRECTMDTLRALSVLEPFGEGNPEPVWMARGLFAASFRTVGRDSRHLQASFDAQGITLRAIGFNMGDRTSELGRPVDIAFRLKPDSWRGGDSVQLVMEDFKPAAERRI